MKPLLPEQRLETVIHAAIITIRLDYCDTLYFGISSVSLSRLHPVSVIKIMFLEHSYNVINVFGTLREKLSQNNVLGTSL